MTGIRSKEELSVILRSWLGQGYVFLQADQVVGYLYEVDGHWREFMLTEHVAVETVLAAWQNYKGTRATTVRLGLHDRKMLPHLGQLAEEVVLEDGHMLRVLNWQTVLQRLLAFRHGILPPESGDKILEIDGERLRIQVSGHGVLVKPSSDKPMVAMTHNQAVTRLLSVQSAWQPDRHLFDDWLPLWFTLPEADGF